MKFTCSDNKEFVIDEDIAKKSIMIKNLIEDLGESEDAIPLSNIDSDDFVIAFQRDYSTLELNKLDRDSLFKIIMAANYLDIPDLLQLGCKAAADYCKGKSAEEIADYLGIEIEA